jgi:N-acetylneuraminic acid mutarotase
MRIISGWSVTASTEILNLDTLTWTPWLDMPTGVAYGVTLPGDVALTLVVGGISCDGDSDLIQVQHVYGL